MTMHKLSDLIDAKRLALGQPGVLGSLYDIRSDNVLPGSILKPIQPPADCVRVLQTPKLTYNVTMGDTVEEKVQNLDICAELSASILGGLLECSLAANYIMKKSSNSRSQSASVTCNMQTWTENLQLENMRDDLLSLSSLENPNATHVICGVEWGARTVIEARTTTVVHTDKHHIGGKPLQPPATKEISSATKSVKKPGETGEPEHIGADYQPYGAGIEKPETSANQEQNMIRDPDLSSTDQFQKNDMLGLKVKNDGALGQVLRQISRVDAGANLQSHHDSHLHTTEVEFKITTDIADFSTRSLPTDHAGVLNFLETLPSNLEKVNNGKGVPVAFQLIPISEVARLFKISRSTNFVLNQIDQGVIKDAIRILDKLMVTTQECIDHEAFVRAHLFCIPKSYHKVVNKSLKAAEGAKESFHRDIRKALRSIRFEGGDVGQIQDILEEYEEDKPDEAEHYAMLQEYREKARLADETKERGANYFKFDEPALNNIIASGTYEDIYVFHFSEKMRQAQASTWTDNWKKLFELLDNLAPQECVIILDYDVGTTQVQKDLEKPFIQQWRDGHCIVPDLVEDLKTLAQECLIKCDDATKADRRRIKEPPSSKRLVRLRCPGTHCFEQRRKCKWICPRCRTHVFYGFDDDDLYCRCSRYPFSSAIFKCSSKLHGREWTKPDTAHLRKQLGELEVSREYNILLLGATGIGKSTFINAFLNYLQFDSLNAAISDPGEARYAIPAYFDMEEEIKADPDWCVEPGQFIFSLGDQNSSEQFSKNGESSTMLSKIYRFTVDDLVIQLIDTPGIGDTRGRHQDKKNIRNILATLESIDRLSGIMFLLKPNEPRNTEAFSYYMKELMRHLHIDASKNILFGFTHSEPGDFRLGATKAPLDQVLAELDLKGIRNDDTQFFFDSSVFEFIVKTKKYPTKHFRNCQKYEVMWNKSTEEVYRLIERVENLPVHEVRKTLCLNRTRDFLEALPKPLTEFAASMKASQDGVIDFQKKLAKLDIEDGNLAEKLSQLKIPITYTERVDLPSRRVVCGHKDCDELTACHDDCDIAAPDGVRDIANIQGCKAFRKFLVMHFGACSRCNHPASDHMMLSYRMEKRERPLNNEEIHKCQAERTAQVDARNSLRQEQELAARFLAQICEEENQISAAQVVVGTYLGAFALGTSEDMFVKYLKSQIDRAQSTGAYERAKKLKEQQAEYEDQMYQVQNLIKAGQSVSLTEKDVDGAMDGLKRMDIFGKFLTQSLGEESLALEERGVIAIPCRDGAKSKGLMKKLWSWR